MSSSSTTSNNTKTTTTLNNNNETTTTTLNNNNSSTCPSRDPPNPQACAACKHQRRKCTPDCLLAPFFPSSATSSFLNAHRLFGVKKITKSLQALTDPTQRALAAQSIIAHANIRANDPVGGCLRMICNFNRQIEICSAELAAVNGQLGMFRAQQENNSNVFVANNNNNNNGDNGGYDAGYDDVAGEEDRMIMRLIDGSMDLEENKEQVFGLRNKFEVKEDVELERQVAQDEETGVKVAASLNFSSLGDFVQKVEVDC